MMKAYLAKTPNKIEIKIHLSMMVMAIIKEADISDRIQPAYVHSYTWQGLPDNLIDLKGLAETAFFIATELDEHILTLEDFNKPWSLYQTGISGQTWRIKA